MGRHAAPELEQSKRREMNISPVQAVTGCGIALIVLVLVLIGVNASESPASRTNASATSSTSTGPFSSAAPTLDSATAASCVSTVNSALDQLEAQEAAAPTAADAYRISHAGVAAVQAQLGSASREYLAYGPANGDLEVWAQLSKSGSAYEDLSDVVSRAEARVVATCQGASS